MINKLSLEFIPDTSQEAQLVDVPLYDSIVAAAILERQGITFGLDRIGDGVGELDVLLVRSIGQVIDFTKEGKMTRQSFLHGKVQLCKGFLPDIHIVIGRYLVDPVTGIGKGQLYIETDMLILIQQGYIPYI